MKAELTKELYKSAVDEVRAPAELLRKVKDMDSVYNTEKKTNNKTIYLRRTALVAAAVVILFALSNAVSLAATGTTWVGRLFLYSSVDDEGRVSSINDPSSPVRELDISMDVNGNIALKQSDGSTSSEAWSEEQELNARNGIKFADEIARRHGDIYGGAYIENGDFVILLTDLSFAEKYSNMNSIRFEKCEYTYGELTGAIDKIAGRWNPLWRRDEGYARDIAEISLADKENRLHVLILDLNDEKIAWFTENIYDAEFIVFDNTDTMPVYVDD